MAGQGTITVRIVGDDGHLSATLGHAESKLKSFGSSMMSAGQRMQSFGLKASASVTLPLVAAGKAAIDMASDLNESLSKSNTIFGAQAKVIEQWASGAAKAFGQSKQQALDAAGTFGNMFTQLGIGSDQAAKMSMRMTELASDFASFHNADITEVLQAQTAAFRGEFDAVQRFVPMLNAAAVENAALNMGLAKSTKELTAQHKALAVQEILVRGAGSAMGDFARTSDGVANSTRIAQARFSDAAASLGQALLPVMSTVTAWASNLAEAFTSLSRPIQTVILVAAGLLAALGPLVAMIGTLVTVVGFLAAHPIVLLIAAIAALAAGLVYAYNKSETFRNIVKKAFEVVVEAAIFMKNVIVTAIQFVVNNWLLQAEAITKAAAFAFGWVPGLGDKLKTAAKAVEAFRDDVNTALDGIKSWDPTKGSGAKTSVNDVSEISRFGNKVKKEMEKAGKDAGEAGGKALTTGLGNLLDKQTGPVKEKAKKLAKTVADQLGDVLGGFDAIGRRQSARNGLVAAIEEMNELLAEQAALPVRISRAEEALARARADASKVTLGEWKQVLEAEEAIAAARDKVAEAYADWELQVRASSRTSDEALRAQRRYEIALLEQGEAEEELAKAKKATTGETEDVTEAEQKLKDLRERQRTITDDVKRAQDALTQAKLAAVQAEKDYLDQQEKLIGSTPKAIEEFRKLAERVGISKDEIEKLIDAQARLRAGLGGSMPSLTGGAGLRPFLNPLTGRTAVTGPNGEAGILNGDPRVAALMNAGVGLQHWTNPFTGQVTWFAPGQGIDAGNLAALRGAVPGFDSGGIVPGRRGAPMMVLAHGGETILPTHKGGAVATGGTAIHNWHVTINQQPGESPESVVRALQAWVRTNGPLPVSTR